MTTNTLLWLATLLFGLGLWLCLRVVYAVVADIAGGIFVRMRRSLPAAWQRAQKQIEQEQTIILTQGAETGNPLRAALTRPIPLFVGFGLAVLLHDWLLSPLAVVISTLLSVVVFSRSRRTRWAALTDQTEMLIAQFVARYPLRNSVVRALNESLQLLTDETLRQACSETATRLELGQYETAFLPLQRIPHASVRRFAKTLAQVNRTTPEGFRDALASLQKDVDSQRDLQQRIRQDLTLIASTINVLQVALGLALIGIAIAPAWREYYLSGVGTMLLYYAFIASGLVGTLFAENEMHALEEMGAQ